MVGVHYGTGTGAAAQTVQQIRDAGGSAFAFWGQPGVPGDADELRTAFDQHADGVDILVNNAGILGTRTPFTDLTRAELDTVFAVNTTAPVFVVQQGLTRLRDGGRIVNISTRFTHGMRILDLLAYAMSKAAVDAFTATLAKEPAARRITVNAVGTGSVDTDMNAARLATPEGRAAVAAQSPFNKGGRPGRRRRHRGLPGVRRFPVGHRTVDRRHRRVVALMPTAIWIIGLRYSLRAQANCSRRAPCLGWGPIFRPVFRRVAC